MGTVRYYYKYLHPIQYVGMKGILTEQFFYWAQAWLGITIFLAILLLPISIQGKRLQRFLDTSDKYSYDIYLMHMIFVKGALSLIFVGEEWGGVVLAFFISIISGILLFHLCKLIRNRISILR
jgi:peptidoglycan/LPS O-acetylase OafA/YrhL